MKQNTWRKPLPVYLLPIMLLFGVLFLPSSRVYAASLTVDSVLDSSDASAGDGSCDDGSGNCTLRAAIEEANALAGADTINFNIAGSGVHTFQPSSEYDAIADELVIDGYSQPGATANTALSPSPFNGMLTIEIDGTNAGTADGLDVGASNVTIKGLVINRFDEQGINIQNFNNVIVQGNYIGTDPGGLIGRGNGLSGIENNSMTGTGNVVGGITVDARNIISGNQAHAVRTGSNLLIQGNYFGLDATGTGSLENLGGLPGGNLMIEGDNNIIGGSLVGAKNVIVGSVSGVLIFDANDNKVKGNLIGTNASGSIQSGFGGSLSGVALIGGQNNLIGGSAEGEGNLIAGNGSGLIVGDIFSTYLARNNSILGNSVHDNNGGQFNGLGIDLLGNTDDTVTYTDAGVTANDLGDGDELSNHLINYPVISRVAPEGNSAKVTYSLDINDAEVGATGYRVEFFANSTNDGEGEIYLGSDTIASDVTGKSITLNLPSGVPEDYYITATTTMTDASTDGFGHTSEFSAPVQAVVTGANGSQSSGATLADTGQDTMSITLLAGAMLATGISGAVLISRKGWFYG
ncbi:hypothetical protein KA529_03430 [Candidatus Saccharibacteria bacterium]|nr:hypothetical protein [Candidatus Saccharibacteria bacterium]